MKTANPQLFAALDEAPRVTSHVNRWDDQMDVIGEAIKADKHTMRGVSYRRQSYTVGALLAYDSTVRDMAINAGINIRVFDDIIAQVNSLMQQHAAKPPPGQKLANILCKITGVPF